MITVPPPPHPTSTDHCPTSTDPSLFWVPGSSPENDLTKFHILWKGILRHIELLICINSHRDLILPTKTLPLYSRFIPSAPVPYEAFWFSTY